MAVEWYAEMSIAVLGAGAIGASVAADLIEAGADVLLVDQWPAHVDAMRQQGLLVRLADHERRLRVEALHLCDLCSLLRRFDIVFLAVKAYDTRWSCELIKPYLQPDGVVVGLQNGMTTADIADVVNSSRTLGCVIEMAADMFEPGIVTRHTPADRTWFGLGNIHPSSERKLEEVEALFRHVGKVSIPADIMSAKWMKVVVNAVFLGFLSTLGLSIRAAAALPGARELMLRIGTEALDVGQRAGYSMQPIFGMKRDEIAGSNHLLESIFDKLISDVGPNARPAVLHDHLKGRYSEVDAINGLVVSEGLRFKRPTPANEAVVELTRQIFAGRVTPDPTNLARIHMALDTKRDGD
jgi:2-dehydropantoate 2-reductase